MSELDALKYDSQLPLEWLQISELLQDMSRHLRCSNTDQLEKNLISLIEFTLTVAKMHDISMTCAWNKWKVKAFKKEYNT